MINFVSTTSLMIAYAAGSTLNGHSPSVTNLILHGLGGVLAGISESACLDRHLMSFPYITSIIVSDAFQNVALNIVPQHSTAINHVHSYTSSFLYTFAYIEITLHIACLLFVPKTVASASSLEEKTSMHCYDGKDINNSIPYNSTQNHQEIYIEESSNDTLGNCEENMTSEQCINF